MDGKEREGCDVECMDRVAVHLKELVGGLEDIVDIQSWCTMKK